MQGAQEPLARGLRGVEGWREVEKVSESRVQAVVTQAAQAAR